MYHHPPTYIETRYTKEEGRGSDFLVETKPCTTRTLCLFLVLPALLHVTENVEN